MFFWWFKLTETITRFRLKASEFTTIRIHSDSMSVQNWNWNEINPQSRHRTVGPRYFMILPQQKKKPLELTNHRRK